MLSLNRDTRSEYHRSWEFVPSYPLIQSNSRPESCADGGALCSFCDYLQFGAVTTRGGNCE